ncbi:MAG: ATP synthase F1 subunit delta [Candidatus Aminicenantes bacterium]|nr:ATP synthase F1 subunit delta [Candidatus Aminicenantes bacterium]
MKKEILIQRYGRGLINALQDEAEFVPVLGELQDMAGLFFTPGVLDNFLTSPFVVKSKKAQALRDILARAALNPKTTRFLLLLLDKNRLELLPNLVAVLPEQWNESRGILTGRVVSAAALTADQKKRLRERLEELEARPVSLTFFIEPQLVGGLTVTIHHRVYDVSIKGRMDKLREIIIEG